MVRPLILLFAAAIICSIIGEFMDCTFREETVPEDRRSCCAVARLDLVLVWDFAFEGRDAVDACDSERLDRFFCFTPGFILIKFSIGRRLFLEKEVQVGFQ
jgi:hypothetical protein